eukprot:SAG31_NODE_4214_length_3460_cov_2.941386_1_plen_217_part_00
MGLPLPSLDCHTMAVALAAVATSAMLHVAAAIASASTGAAVQKAKHVEAKYLRPTYPIDSAASGPRFDGIGAISGGGGETVLLPNYPEQQRNEILDILFKPNFGASLHILKVEIGGDALSTDGAEPSHMHTETDLDFDRGYEFWVATEAKKRNSKILLYGLPWEWPAWVGEGTGSPWTNVSKAVHYTTQWLKGAKAAHDLDIDFLGVWCGSRSFST